jgi:hypothetical protein
MSEPSKEQKQAEIGKRMAELLAQITAQRAERCIALKAKEDAISRHSSLECKVMNLENEYEKLAAQFMPPKLAGHAVAP